MTSLTAPVPASDSSSLWRSADVRRLAAVSALGFTSFFLTLASVPSWAVQGGAASSSAGLVTTAMLASTVLVQLAVPWLDRRLGTPLLLALGLLALGVPAPLYLISSQLGWLVAVSAVRGMGFAIITVLGALLSTRVSSPERRGEAIGIYGLSIAVPNLVAVPAGSALTSSGHFAWAAVLAASPLLAIPLALRFPRRDDDSAVLAGKPTRRRTAVLAAGGPSLVLLVVTLSGGGLVTFLPIVRPHGALSSIVLLVFGIAGTVGRWRAGVVGARFGTRRVLSLVLAVAAVGLVAVGTGVVGTSDGSAQTALLVGGATLFGIGYGATQNLTQLVAFQRVGADQVVTASAVWNAAFDAGTAIGAYGVGLVAVTGLQISGTYVVCAVLVAAVIPAARATTPRRSRPAPAPS